MFFLLTLNIHVPYKIYDSNEVRKIELKKLPARTKYEFNRVTIFTYAGGSLRNF